MSDRNSLGSWSCRTANRLGGRERLTDLAQDRILYRPETLVVDRRHCGRSCLIGEPYVRAACQGKGGCFDFRAAIVFEISPSPLCNLERGAIKPGPVQDPENPRGGHRIPPLRINEAGDDRTLACLELHDATQSLRQAVQASVSPRRLLHGVLRNIPECGGANLFVRPISGIHDAVGPHS